MCLKTTRSELVFLKTYLVSALQDDPVRSCQRNRETNRFYSNFHPVPPVFVSRCQSLRAFCVCAEWSDWLVHLRPLRGHTWRRQRNVQGTGRTSCFLLRPETRSLPERLFNQPNSSESHMSSNWAQVSVNAVFLTDESVQFWQRGSYLWHITSVPQETRSWAHPEIPANRSGPASEKSHV